VHLVLTIQFLQIDISLVPLELNVRSQQFSSETGRNGGRGYRGSADGSPKSLFNATAESHSSPYCDRLGGGNPARKMSLNIIILFEEVKSRSIHICIQTCLMRLERVTMEMARKLNCAANRNQILVCFRHKRLQTETISCIPP